ncbi:MAG: CYTH domain-containing protein [Candidatus Woesearchaeota archaeon]
MAIEVEIRSLLTKRKYQELKKQLYRFLKSDDFQETYYFKGKDLRTQRNRYYGKIWLKSGNIHDNQREELEVRFSRQDFNKMNQILNKLGFKTEVKWLRKRLHYKWKKIDVSLDHTQGYGHIIELERLCSHKDKDMVLKQLREGLGELGLSETPRSVFEKKLANYKRNWKALIKPQQESS